MNPIYIAVAPLISLYLLWAIYLAVMNLRRAKALGILGPIPFAFGLPLLALGLALDALVNATVMTVLFKEWPREWTVSRRLSRHVRDSTGWRQARALWYCATWLDAFDHTGLHRP